MRLSRQLQASKSLNLVLVLGTILLFGCNPEGLTGGQINVNGTAQSLNFTNYSISWGYGNNPSTWYEDSLVLENSGLSTVASSKLAGFNTVNVSGGKITIRLKVFDSLGQVSEDYYYVTILHVFIESPGGYSFVEANTLVNVSGRALIQNFSNYTLKSCSAWPGSCTLISSGTEPVASALLGVWNTPNITITTGYALELVAYSQNLTNNTDTKLVYVVPADIYEPDNDYTLANWITPGEVQLHNHVLFNDSDWLKFNATQGVVYRIHTFNLSDSDTTIAFYDSDGQTQIVFNDDDADSIEWYVSQIYWSAPSSGTYYFNVKEYLEASGGAYHVRLVQTNLTADSYEPDNSFETATPLIANATQTHNIIGTNDSDYFVINTTPNNLYAVTMNRKNLSQYIFYNLHNSSYGFIYPPTQFPEYYYSFFSTGYDVFSWESQNTMQYYLRLHNIFDFITEDYNITLTTYPFEDVYEPNSDMQTPTSISTDGVFQNQKLGLLDLDYIRFNVTINKSYTIRTFNVQSLMGYHKDAKLVLNTPLLASSSTCSDHYCGINGSEITFTSNVTGNATFYVHSNYSGVTYSVYVTDNNATNCINIFDNVSITGNKTLCNNIFYLSDGVQVNDSLNCSGASIIAKVNRTGNGIVMNPGSTFLTNCKISGFENAVLLNSANNTLIQNNIFTDNSAGIEIGNNSANNTVLNNTFKNNTLAINALFGGNLIYNNTIFDTNSAYNPTSGNDNNYCVNSQANNYFGFFGPGCAPAFLSFQPSEFSVGAVTGSSLAFSAFFADNDSGMILISWDLSGSLLSLVNASANASNASGLNYYHEYSSNHSSITIHDIAQGLHLLSLNISDWYESKSNAWTISAQDPAPQSSRRGSSGGGGSALLSKPLGFVKLYLDSTPAEETRKLKSVSRTTPVKSLTIKAGKKLEKSSIEVRVEDSKSVNKTVADAVTYFSITHTLSIDDFSEARIEFFVAKKDLESLHLKPEEVALYRLEDDWDMLPTLLLEETLDSYEFEALSQGFSLFAVARKKQAVAQEDTQAGEVQKFTSDNVMESRVQPAGQQNSDAEEQAARQDSITASSNSGYQEDSRANNARLKAARIGLSMALVISILAVAFLYARRRPGKASKPPATGSQQQGIDWEYKKHEQYVKMLLDRGMHPHRIRDYLIRWGWPEHFIAFLMQRNGVRLQGQAGAPSQKKLQKQLAGRNPPEFNSRNIP